MFPCIKYDGLDFLDFPNFPNFAQVGFEGVFGTLARKLMFSQVFIK